MRGCECSEKRESPWLSEGERQGEALNLFFNNSFFWYYYVFFFSQVAYSRVKEAVSVYSGSRCDCLMYKKQLQERYV